MIETAGKSMLCAIFHFCTAAGPEIYKANFKADKSATFYLSDQAPKVYMHTSSDKIPDILRFILTKHFNIAADQFDWNQPLEDLDEQFKLLGNLVYLEQLLEEEFQKEIPLLENISTTYHTPKDILVILNGEA